jgi:hypothetical protein
MGRLYDSVKGIVFLAQSGLASSLLLSVGQFHQAVAHLVSLLDHSALHQSTSQKTGAATRPYYISYGFFFQLSSPGFAAQAHFIPALLSTTAKCIMPVGQ